MAGKYTDIVDALKRIYPSGPLSRSTYIEYASPTGPSCGHCGHVHGITGTCTHGWDVDKGVRGCECTA